MSNKPWEIGELVIYRGVVARIEEIIPTEEGIVLKLVAKANPSLVTAAREKDCVRYKGEQLDDEAKSLADAKQEAMALQVGYTMSTTEPGIETVAFH